LNEFWNKNTLLQTKHKTHETGGKTGSYVFRPQEKLELGIAQQLTFRKYQKSAKT
jgi:hypothetical protein